MASRSPSSTFLMSAGCWLFFLLTSCQAGLRGLDGKKITVLQEERPLVLVQPTEVTHCWLRQKQMGGNGEPGTKEVREE